MGERSFDLVVFGAGGVTGRRICSYLERRAPELGLTWAAAGRDRARIGQRLAGEGVDEFEFIEADVTVADRLAEMAAQATVVLNAVGPYTRYGRPVIEACVAAGTHYADLTGEIPFARSIIRDFDAPARAAGVKLVQICGFESMPVDLGVAAVADLARRRHDSGLATVDLEVSFRPPSGRMRLSDGISGGTAQSMAAVMSSPEAHLVTDPAALIDVGEGAHDGRGIGDGAFRAADFAARVRDRSAIAVRPRRGAEGGVVAPMQPAAYINPAVIHRTAALQAAAGIELSVPFRYREGVLLRGGAPSAPLRTATAGLLAGTQVAFALATRASESVRSRVGSALGRLLPDSGFGPEADRLEDWAWGVRIDAVTLSGEKIGCRIEAEGHPGYLTTARILGEAGLVLANGTSPDRAGCLTPAMALGIEHLDRYSRAGLRFKLG